MAPPQTVAKGLAVGPSWRVSGFVRIWEALLEVPGEVDEHVLGGPVVEDLLGRARIRDIVDLDGGAVQQAGGRLAPQVSALLQ